MNTSNAGTDAIGHENSPVESGPEYVLVCPSYAQRCIGKTRRSETDRGTYRNVYYDYDVCRIVCAQCGLVQQVAEGSLECRYWHRIKIGDHVLWAENATRLAQIRDVLDGNADRNKSHLYALPKWLITKANRSKAISQIDQMLADPDLRRICDE